MKASNDNFIPTPKADLKAALAHFLAPLVARPALPKGLELAVIMARDEDLVQGARLATAAYLAHAAGFSDVKSGICSSLKQTAKHLRGNPAAPEAQALAEELEGTEFGHEQNRRAVELAQTALKTPLFMQDVLSAALELEMVLAPGANREQTRERLYTRLATGVLENAAPQPDERAAMGLGQLLKSQGRGF